MKVLLIKPYTSLKVAKRLQEGFLHLEPLELEITAAGVDKKHITRILDLSVETGHHLFTGRPLTGDPFKAGRGKRDLFHETLVRFKPDLIGFSAYSTGVHIVHDLAKRAKVLLPCSTVIVGGIHATLRPYDFKNEYFDVVVRGEGANAISKIIANIEKGVEIGNDTNILEPFDPNFDQNARKSPPPYVDVHSIPLPRRDLVDRSKYFCIWTHSDSRRLKSMFPRVASLRTSLGCPFSCSFCVIHYVMNKAYLQRSVNEVVDEIENLKEDYIYFVDDEMFINIRRVTKIAELLIKRKINKHYISWARSDTIVKHPEIFRLWKKAGLDVVYVGLESMDEKRLEEYNKRTGFETNKKAIQIMKDCGITLHAAFIVHPDFDKNDFKRLEKDVLDLCPAEVTFTVLSPSPGTDLFEKYRDRLICDPFKYYDCMHTIIPTKMTLKRFYQHFGRLYSLALRSNPLKVNKIRVNHKDLLKSVFKGTKYVSSLYNIYRDYPEKMHLKKGDKLFDAAKKEGFAYYEKQA